MQGSARLLFVCKKESQTEPGRCLQGKPKTSRIRLKSLHMDKCTCCTDKYEKRLIGSKLIEEFFSFNPRKNKIYQ